MTKPRIYDCFCYFNEDLILELRLETLWDFVDFFVISEASYTHAGLSRETQFDITKFQKYASKIRYIRLDVRPEGGRDFWKNENFIRNNVVNGLFDAISDDLVMISDLDEIPNPEKINEYLPKYLRGDFDQRYYSYYFNNYWLGDADESGKVSPNSNIWRGTKITTYHHFVNFFKCNATSVRSYKSSGMLRSIKRTWFKWFSVQLIKDGGWHFTWVFTLENIIKKIQSTAHQEFNRPEFKDPQKIRDLIASGRDFHKPFSRYELQDIDEQFPRYLIENLEKFSEFIYLRDEKKLEK
jgi:beta-1,4-mannosyl-glycoprotein beta-1,4-N-acetylglucosaminyltransferase